MSGVWEYECPESGIAGGHIPSFRSVLGLNSIAWVGTPQSVTENSEKDHRCEQLPDGGEDADIGLAVTLVFGPRAMIAKEGFDALGEVGGLLTVDMDDERRAFAVAVVDDQRESVELVGVTIIAELLGNEVYEIGE